MGPSVSLHGRFLARRGVDPRSAQEDLDFWSGALQVRSERTRVLKGGPCQTRGALQRLAVLLLISLQPRSKLILVYPDAPKPAKPILLNLKAIQPLYHHPFMFGLNFLVVEGRLTAPPWAVPSVIDLPSMELWKVHLRELLHEGVGADFGGLLING